MPLTNEQEFQLKQTELAIKSAEVGNRKEELQQQDRQRRTSALVTIVAALVAVAGSLGSQVVAKWTADKPDARKETLTFYMGTPLIKSEQTGIYAFDPKTGQLWIAKEDAPGKVSWIA